MSNETTPSPTLPSSVDSHTVAFEAAPVPWPPGRAPLTGTPLASDFPLAEGRVEAGIWECTPGSWNSSVEGYSELMHFISGHATITSSTGEVVEARPGVVFFVDDGWTGTWVVHETIRKSYCIVHH